MSKPLAIVTPLIGLCSETFIQRHIRDLLPEQTVTVTASFNQLETNNWSVNCPILAMNWLPQSGFRGRRVQINTCTTQLFNQIIGKQSTEHNWIDVKHFLREHQVQVIMGEYLDKCVPWLKVAQELGIPFFAHAHGYDVSRCLQVPKWRKQYLRYNETDGIITMSQASRQKLLDLGLQPNKIHVIPYGVDVPANPLMRVEQETVRCLAVGRMVAKKAPLKTLEAFYQAAQVNPKLRLDYVGTGDLLPIVQDFVRTSGLDQKVTLHGGQPNEVVHQLMKKADIFLQHSIVDPKSGDEEGLPVAILEAMAHSLPIVSTHHAGIPEAVLDGSTGYLVQEGDSSAMADCIIMLAHDPELRQRIGEAGWNRAKEYFSWEREQQDLLRILELKQHKTTKQLASTKIKL